jgi:hypothetical protein
MRSSSERPRRDPPVGPKGDDALKQRAAARRALAPKNYVRRPVSRVLYRPETVTIIPLDRPLPDGSRDLPGRLGR